MCRFHAFLEDDEDEKKASEGVDLDLARKWLNDNKFTGSATVKSILTTKYKLKKLGALNPPTIQRDRGFEDLCDQYRK